MASSRFSDFCKWLVFPFIFFFTNRRIYVIFKVSNLRFFYHDSIHYGIYCQNF